MTQPQQSESDALDALAGLAAGNSSLTSRPNLMQSLVNGSATRADASVANQFVGALEAENAVQRLRSSGQKVILPSQMVASLNAIGAQYSDVQTSKAQIEAAAVASIKKQGLVPVYADGDLIGARQQNEQEQAKAAGGWFDSFGGFFHHLTHNPVTNVIGEGFNLAQQFSTRYGALGAVLAPDDNAANDKLMQAVGYDPNSLVSQLAYDAKGYERSNLQPIIDKYGIDKVARAQEYLADPKRYTDEAIQQANKVDPSGKAAQQAVAELTSKDFGGVLTQLGARSRSVGTYLAQAQGFDPAKDPGVWSFISGGIDFVSSFFLDPTLAVLKGAQLLRVAQIGINGFVDTRRIATILDKTNGGLYARRVQRGFQSAVDNGNLIREGNAARAAAESAGDLHGVATAEAQISRGYANLDAVGLKQLAPALVGSHRVVGLDAANKGYLKVVEGGEPLDTYDKLFTYVTDTHGLLQLQAGKAAVESSLMPGALSRWGSTRVRLALNGALQGRRAELNFAKMDAARFLPAANDAVDVTTGEHLSQTALDQTEETGLASQRRAIPAIPSAAQLGQAEYNLRRYGNVAGQGVLGKSVSLGRLGEFTPGSWLNPTAVAARARLARARLDVRNVLPRNNKINLLDELGADKVYAFARTYLPEQQSRLLAATFQSGDFGARRAVLHGMKTQVFHAAGLYHTESGRAFAEKWLSDDMQLYGHTVDTIMERDPWTGAQDVSTALWGAQNRLEYSIPSFAQMHQLAGKFGLYDSTVGRMMTSHIADSIGTKVRTSLLLSPRTAVRATVEGWVNMLARGDARRALATKAMLAEGKGLPARLAITEKATGWFLPRAVGNLVRRAEKRGLTDQEAEYLTRVLENHPDIATAVHDSLSQHLLRGDIHPTDQMVDALDIARSGFRPVEWERDAWKAQDVTGHTGALRLEAALKLRAHQNPATFAAVLEHINTPTAESLAKVKDAMLDPTEYAQFRRMRWLNVYRDDTGALQRATDEYGHQLAFEQHAQRLVNDLAHLVTKDDGSLSEPLLTKMRTDGVPDSDWIDNNLLGKDRPASAIAPSYLPKVVESSDDFATAKAKLAAALQDLSGKAYKAIVTRPAERMTSMPAFWANYLKVRTQLAPLEERLISEGHFTADTADELLMHRAIRQAWVRTEYTVDDPGLKTQMDIVGRNLLAFPRAVNAFLRRYGQLARQNPAAVRQAFLTVQGAEHMGFVYKDQNGELTYTVPGSGFLVNALNEFGRWMGYQNFVALPSGDLTGKVLMSAPGFDAPARFSLSPMLNIPFQWFANMFPDHREMIAEIDNVLNGGKGSNRTPLEQLMPAALSHFWEALDPNDRDSLRASATIGAFANLAAADPTGSKGIMPKPGTDPTGSQLTALMGTLKTQVRNQLFMRAVLGLWLPGSPSRPADTLAESRADEAYFIRGARTLSDEFKLMIDDFGGDYQAALQSFITLHPNGTVYTQPTSKVTQAGLSIPATRPAEAWMEKNYGLIEKYPLIAGYFVPQTPGKFDANAWQAQLDTGLRRKKSIQDFVDQYELSRGQTAYFGAYQQMKQIRDQFDAEGNSRAASAVQANFTEQMQPFLAANPLLREYLTIDNAQKAVQSQHAILQLRDLVSSGEVRGLPNGPIAANMLSAWDRHEAFQHAKGANDPGSRSNERAGFALWMEDLVVQHPELVGLYNAFRAVDFTSLPRIQFGDGAGVTL